MKGLTWKETNMAVNEWIKKLGLSEKSDTAAKNLSGGQKRKLQLGMALIGSNQIVFLDEPTSGMDPESRRYIWDCLQVCIFPPNCIQNYAPF